MNEKTSKNQKLEPIFPDNSGLIIKKILEKYGLIAEQEEGIKKMKSLEISPETRKEIFKNLPGRRIVKLVRDYGERRISLKDIPVSLEKELNISEKEAKEITKELEETLLIFIKQTPIEEMSTKEFTEEKPVKEKKIELEDISDLDKKKEAKTPSRQDVYREPIE